MSATDDTQTIRWPPEFAREQCGVHVSNELEMSVPADRVWSWLIHAREWPSYYDNAQNVVFITDTESPTLKENTQLYVGAHLMLTSISSKRVCGERTDCLGSSWVVRPLRLSCLADRAPTEWWLLG